MADGKSILVDVSRCTGCRGCQVACKQWNGLPGTRTKQTGTYQNPPDFSHQTFKVVRFEDGRTKEGKTYWHFFSDMCRHCMNPPCLAGAQGDEMIHDEATGAVVYTEGTSKSDFEMSLSVCPYDIPRQNPDTKVMYKCTMCFDRITSGLPPACVLSCPTGAMVFGERDAMLAEARRRVDILKKTWPKAQALNADDVRVIFIVTDDPLKYHKYAAGV